MLETAVSELKAEHGFPQGSPNDCCLSCWNSYSSKIDELIFGFCGAKRKS